MRVERYQENDMRTAMSKVRMDLGEDAVIISSRRVGGRTEIMAALDYDPTQLEAAMQKFSGSVKKERRKKNPDKVDDKKIWEILDGENDNVVKVDEQPIIMNMQEELGKLRKLFEGELAQLAWRDEGKRQPNRQALVSRLEVAGINREIGIQVVDKVLPCADLELGWRRVLRVLSRVIKISMHDVMKDGGVIALVGSTGVGKTTTAAKIAAQFAERHGKNSVAFISTDNSRVGGQEQLISLGSSLGVPVQVATSREEMKNTLASLSERKLIIIDTAGVSQRDKCLLEKYQSLAVEDNNIHPFLVLSATSRESVINETIRAYSSIDITAAIITKTDESDAIGPVLSGLIRNKLDIAFVGNGQRIKSDLEPAMVERFISNILMSYGAATENTSSQRAKKILRRDKQKCRKLVNV